MKMKKINKFQILTVLLAVSCLFLFSGCAEDDDDDGSDPPASETERKMTAYLKAPNAEASDLFGSSIDIDEDTVIVGATGESNSQTSIVNGATITDDNSSSGSGAAYIFICSEGEWSHQAYLKAPNAGSDDSFGESVAVSGDTVVVGANMEDNSNRDLVNGSTITDDNGLIDSGAAYVYVRSGTDWSQQAYFKPNTTEGAGDNFGYAVDINSDTIVVGAPLDDNAHSSVQSPYYSFLNGGSDRGSAHVFTRSGTTWSWESYLQASNSGDLDQFGTSAAISGDTIVIGAPYEDNNQTTITNDSSITDNDDAESAGAVYVFVRSGTTWSLQSYLKAPNAEAGDRFGTSVAISDDTIVVGAINEDSSQTTITDGSSIADNNDAENAGAAYVFVRSGTEWSLQSYLKASNAEANDGFGKSVKISDDTIVVGADSEDSNDAGDSANNDASNAGAAYVFTRSDTSWSQEAYLKASNAGESDNLGYSVSVSGDTVIAGAHGESSSQQTITNSSSITDDNDDASNAGAVYISQ